MSDTDSDLKFYLKHHGMFLSDFWSAGNFDLNIAIEPRSVQSGCWYTATWKTREGEDRYITAQWHKLIWERIIRRYLEDERRKGEEMLCPSD